MAVVMRWARMGQWERKATARTTTLESSERVERPSMLFVPRQNLPRRAEGGREDGFSELERKRVGRGSGRCAARGPGRT